MKIQNLDIYSVMIVLIVVGVVVLIFRSSYNIKRVSPSVINLNVDFVNPAQIQNALIDFQNVNVGSSLGGTNSNLQGSSGFVNSTGLNIK